MTSQIESAAATASVVAGIKAGNEVLASIHGEMDAVAVEAVMDDLREAAEVQSELQRALGEGLGLEATEEADAEAEYEAMMAEEEVKEVLSADYGEIEAMEDVYVPDELLSDEEKIRLLESALLNLKLRDFASHKKFFTWFMGHLDDEEVEPPDDDPAIKAIVPALKRIFLRFRNVRP